MYGIAEKTKEENEATSRGNLSKCILSANYKVSLNFNRTLIIFSKKRGCLFGHPLYSNIAGYIAFTYLIFQLLKSWESGYVLLIYYFPFSCIAYILFLINKKSHFAHE
jgi:hypothetical protein